jgi:hypothetical protein
MGIYQKDLDLLNDNRLIRWYGMNCHIEHGKLTPIPIGIANNKWPHGDEALLNKVISLNLSKCDRIYCNFDPNTNPIRKDIRKIVESNQLVDIEYKKLCQEEYWMKLASYKYVISPPGNSVDCHRIWESLYLKTIPICLKSVELKSFHIYNIDSFSNIDIFNLNTKKYLDTNLHDFNYWRSMIKS